MKVGDRRGGFTFIEEMGFTTGKVPRRMQWRIRCDCGAEYIRASNCVRDFCMCQNFKHGMSKSPEFNTWARMLARCSNPNAQDFRYYGGRGISVADRWKDFASFFADVGPRPSPGHSIDRIDTNGNYEPGNVRWATKETQAGNTSRNVYVQTPQGPVCLRKYCRDNGLVYTTIHGYIRNGLSPNAAVEHFSARRTA